MYLAIFCSINGLFLTRICDELKEFKQYCKKFEESAKWGMLLDQDGQLLDWFKFPNELI